jgi:hypothetical protein
LCGIRRITLQYGSYKSQHSHNLESTPRVCRGDLPIVYRKISTPRPFQLIKTNRFVNHHNHDHTCASSRKDRVGRDSAYPQYQEHEGIGHTHLSSLSHPSGSAVRICPNLRGGRRGDRIRTEETVSTHVKSFSIHYILRAARITDSSSLYN